MMNLHFICLLPWFHYCALLALWIILMYNLTQNTEHIIMLYYFNWSGVVYFLTFVISKGNNKQKLNNSGFKNDFIKMAH